MSTPRIVRTTLLLAASFFLLGTQCGDEFDQLVAAICAQNPSLPDCQSVVFVTSTLHNGDLGGLSGADRICNDRAAAAGMGTKRFVAWLSTTTVDARDRLTEPRGKGFVRTDGALVATSIADLTDGTIANPIRLDENGSDVGSRLVWTGTDADGTLRTLTCSDWTDGSGAPGGQGGRTTDTDDDWTLVFGALCHLQAPLYCFEVHP